MPRFPVISLRDDYPRGETPEKFWGDKTAFYRDYESRLAAGAVDARELTVMGHLYDLELLRRAGEARIREYNKYAREQNKLNGYE